MMFFLFERWFLCANSLTEGALTCGVRHRKYPYDHYSGNFWWSTCEHVVSVTHPCHTGRSWRHSAEFWILANDKLFSDNKIALELWDGASNEKRYTRDKYNCVDQVIGKRGKMQMQKLGNVSEQN